MNSETPTEKHLDVLRKYFGHSQFRPMQWKIIHTVMENQQDSCVIMATGYGKSLCYQYPAVFRKGLSIVVSPLISLMQDQVLALKMSNIPACFLGAAQSSKQKSIDEVLSGNCRVLYVTPEWCTGDYGMDMLKKIHDTINVTLLAIDEAHCVSQWGFDFRHSYRKLGSLREVLINVPFLTVTATATPQVQVDICKSLALINPVVICTGFDRPNLYFAVSLKTDSPFRDFEPLLLKDGLNYRFQGPTIIYCPTKKQTEKISEILNGHGLKTAAYHADMSLKQRQNVHESFLKDKLPAVVATVAFGMGIDKPDVRCVIHYGAPKEIESYYQEVGRAGRDGLPAKCHVFYSYADFQLNKYFISSALSEKYRQHRELMARSMQQYLETRGCRRQLLLSYFKGGSKNPDETQRKPNCCDNCSKWNTNGGSKVPVIDVNVTEEIKLLLRAVNLMNGRFGLTIPVKFLRGSPDGKIPKGLLSHELYGTGKSISEPAWKSLGRLCIRDGLLSEKTCQMGDRHFICSTVGVSKLGLDFIRRGEECGIKIVPPLEVEVHFRKKMKLAVSENLGDYKATVKPSLTNDIDRPQFKAKKEIQAKLYNCLLRARSELASENECLPHHIAENKMLYQVASKMPVDRAALALIDGFTDAKIEKFGHIILQKVREFSKTESENSKENSKRNEMTLDVGFFEEDFGFESMYRNEKETTFEDDLWENDEIFSNLLLEGIEELPEKINTKEEDISEKNYKFFESLLQINMDDKPKVIAMETETCEDKLDEPTQKNKYEDKQDKVIECKRDTVIKRKFSYEDESKEDSDNKKMRNLPPWISKSSKKGTESKISNSLCEL